VGRKLKPPTNAENSVIDTLIAAEDAISYQFDTETDPAKYLALSDELARVRRVRHGIEQVLFGGDL